MSPQWRSEKLRRPREIVDHYVQVLTEQLSDDNLGLQFTFAGSWRRNAPVIGDLDIVVTTETGRLAPDLLDPAGVVLPSFVEFQRLGPKIAQGDIRLPDGPLHVDFWSCTPRERAAFLMFATGPMPLNIAQRRHAVSRGMALSQIGLLDRATKVQLDSGTSEREIYCILGLPWLTPEERQRFADQSFRKSEAAAPDPKVGCGRGRRD